MTDYYCDNCGYFAEYRMTLLGVIGHLQQILLCGRCFPLMSAHVTNQGNLMIERIEK